MTLSAERVEAVFRACIVDTEDLPTDQPLEENEDLVLVDGIVWQAYLSKAKLAEHATEIGAMLMELPEQFRKTGGGGWSFLQACDDRHGVQWTGLHLTMAQLFGLGQGLGYVSFLMPREMWSVMPGGMPYLLVHDDLIGQPA